MRFRQFVWDPWLLTAQMVCLQSLFYLSFLFWASVVTFLGTGRTVDLVHVLSANGISDSDIGWFVCAGQLLAALSSGAWLVAVVGRAKLCLDFSATLHIFHVIYCIVYAGLPRTLWWWGILVASCAVTTVSGEYLCMRRELREIPVVGGRPPRPKDTTESIPMTNI